MANLMSEQQFPSLYSRYNGFTLGAFLASLCFPYSQRRYSAFRQRIEEFLLEIGIAEQLPKTQKAYPRQFDQLLDRILTASKQRSATLHDFAGLGVMAVFQAAHAASMTDTNRRVLHDRWCPVLERHGVQARVYDEWLQELPQGQSQVYAENLLSPASMLLAHTLESLKPEPDTCFVAMPFRRPFTDYFTRFYRPALERAGMCAVRAWGGLSSEEYYMFLLTLIARSGAVMAELSTLNANVINEIGVAHGAIRVVFLIGNKSLRKVPSNLAHLPIHTYDDRKQDWLPGAIDTCAEYIIWMREDFDRRYSEA
jgi:hypothetical protein